MMLISGGQEQYPQDAYGMQWPLMPMQWPYQVLYTNPNLMADKMPEPDGYQLKSTMRQTGPTTYGMNTGRDDLE